MKKILITLCGAAMALSLTCCKNTKTSALSEADQALSDSVATAFGQLVGAGENGRLEQMKMMDPTRFEDFDREAYLKGIEYAVMLDTANMSYVYGVSQGIQIWGSIVGMSEQSGIPIDPAIVMNEIKKAFNNDSLDRQALQMNFMALQQRLMERGVELQNERIAASPESQQNLADGEAYANKCLEEGYEKTEDGLVYKIHNPGSEEKITTADMVTVDYRGTHVNGEVFDEGTDAQMALSRVVPGFREGLQLIGNGGSITIVVPADLAYSTAGVEGTIGPNETLVFDITVKGVNGQEAQ